MSSQLERWQGQFGKEYTDRNHVDWQDRWCAFDSLFRGIEVRSVLEVGCNRGHNLNAIRYVTNLEFVDGVEPQAYARELAQQDGLRVFAGTIYDLPEQQYDLVFTCGVLEHIPPELLDSALIEMHRCARRYLLAIEYHATLDTPVPYRGHDDMLWKRDYGAHCLRLFPHLRLLVTSDFGSVFDGARYWLLEKP